ncbi:MAG: hypothetical protein HPY57_13385 [Ignavibacteria bacterium]|nr:hypothetical protein [Ignavibacteria bacterium]
MDIKLKENVIFTPYDDSKLLKEKILEFIFESKTDKILYKGNPTGINYKLLKKILPLDQIKLDKDANSLNNFIEIKSDNIREVYNDFIQKMNCKLCLIYKI